MTPRTNLFTFAPFVNPLPRPPGLTPDPFFVLDSSGSDGRMQLPAKPANPNQGAASGNLTLTTHRKGAISIPHIVHLKCLGRRCRASAGNTNKRL